MVERWLQSKPNPYINRTANRNRRVVVRRSPVLNPFMRQIRNNKAHFGKPVQLFKDSDRDGVPNVFDCRPFNRKRQDVISPFSTGQGIHQEMYQRQEQARLNKEYQKQLAELQRIAEMSKQPDVYYGGDTHSYTYTMSPEQASEFEKQSLALQKNNPTTTTTTTSSSKSSSGGSNKVTSGPGSPGWIGSGATVGLPSGNTTFINSSGKIIKTTPSTSTQLVSGVKTGANKAYTAIDKAIGGILPGGFVKAKASSSNAFNKLASTVKSSKSY